MPKFSIILPVRNGGEYVKECVASILAQNCTDFNLHVLDNCSSDGTLDWIRSVSDERIVIYPSDKPLSIEDNWARILSISKNEFMTCIGHDDILLPDYLAEMNELIEKFPGAALYQSYFNFIDAKGAVIRPCKPVNEKESAAEFLYRILTNDIDVNGTGFMTRSAAYEAMGGIPAYPNLLFADLHLWIDITRPSYKITSKANCFSYRLHQSMTSTSADESFHAAFERFVNYLHSLKLQDPALGEVVNNKAKNILSFYCRSFSHRLLRTEMKQRNGYTVKEWAKKCDGYADLLTDNNSYKPSAISSVRLAQFIDSNAFTRKLFLVFKKIYPKPIFK